MLTREQILASAFPEAEKVYVPEWGGDVYVSVMTGTQRERFEAAVRGDKGNIRARLAICTLRDEGGNPLFTEADIESLGAKSWIVLDRLFDVGVRVNAIGKSDIEALAKNS